MILWKKLCCYGQKYGTMNKTKVLYRELYGTSNYKENNMVEYQKLRNFNL